MKVAFIGASGKVGSQVVPFLAPKFELTLFGFESSHVEWDGQTRPVHALDITDFAACLQALEGADAVVNCAVNDYSRHNRNAPDELLQYHEGCIDVNVRGAFHLYEAAIRCGVEDFAFVSSLTTHLGLPSHSHIGKDSELRPVNIYACTKLFGDQVGQMVASHGDLRVKSLRLGQPYPCFKESFDDRWPYAPSRTRGCYVAVEDIARAIGAALTSPQISYGAYPIVSHSDDEWIDPHSASEIGYQPIYDFQPLRLLRAGIEIQTWPATQELTA